MKSALDDIWTQGMIVNEQRLAWEKNKICETANKATKSGFAGSRRRCICCY